MFCKMLETEKIQRVNQQLEEVSRKINANSGIWEKALQELRLLCMEKARLIGILNYLQH